jgi:hypothetical protein
VKVDSRGRVYLNGAPASLEDLRTEFARLARVAGAVFYSRENPETDPPPEVNSVIQSVINAITAERLPVALVRYESA